MTMKNWIEHVNKILEATGEKILLDSGRISRNQMEKKVTHEYRKYSKKTLTQVEKDYLRQIHSIEKIAIKGGGKDD